MNGPEAEAGDVLVTGGAGVLGRHFLAAYRPSEAVITLDRSAAPESRRHILHNLTRPLPAAIRASLASVTHLVHLADEMTTETAPREGWSTLYERHISATAALLEDLPALRHVTLASSYMVYAAGSGTITEADPPWPGTAYAWGKCALEAAVASSGVPFAALRLAGVYGPGVPLGAGRTIMRLVEAAVRGVSVGLYGDGSGGRNHLFLDDAVEALRRCVAERWLGTFNVGGPDLVPVAAMVDHLGSLSGRPLAVSWSSAGGSDTVFVDGTALRCLYGFRPAVGIFDGLGRYYDWARRECAR